MHEEGTHLLVEGKGCHVKDAEGTSLLDGLAGLWCVNVGYNCTAIVEAVRQQLVRLPYYPSFFNSTTEPPVQLAAKLASLAPARVNRTIFSTSGSEANETALKIIRAYQHATGHPERQKILTREFAYHGVTLATTSMTGLDNCTEPFALPLPEFIQAPAPYRYRYPEFSGDETAFTDWCIEATRRVIEREGPETIAALFAEPVQGAGGVIVPPEGYLGKLRALAHDYEILFVADEVITGLGRLGHWFASDLWDLDPDLIVLAKGLTSGYLPGGATMIADEIADVLFEAGPFAHGHTYSGHPACCAAALANLETIEKERLLPYLRETAGPLLQQGMDALASHPAVAAKRGMGLIGALELHPHRPTPNPASDGLLGLEAAKRIREEGVIVRGIRNCIAIAPPFIITPEEIDELCDGIRRGLDKLESGRSQFNEGSSGA